MVYFPYHDQLAYVRLVDSMGSDELISQIAGISHDSEKGPGVANLLKWKHVSPFEFGQVIFKIKLPIFVERQLFRHRAGSYMEKSARYISFERPDFFIPEKLRRDGAHREEDTAFLIDAIRSYFERGKELYRLLRAHGVTKELARIVFPVSLYSEYFFRIDLRHLIELLKLRMDHHAQAETRKAAMCFYLLAKDQFPQSLAELDDLYDSCVHELGPVKATD